MEKVTGVISHQFSKLVFQLVGLKIPGIHAMDEDVCGKLSEMLSPKLLISVFILRLGLERFFLFTLL